MTKIYVCTCTYLYSPLHCILFPTNAENILSLLNVQKKLLSSRPDSLILQLAPTVSTKYGDTTINQAQESQACALIATGLYARYIHIFILFSETYHSCYIKL